MKIVFTLLAISAFSFVSGQNFSVGHHSAAFIDASRNNRNIPVEIYYPANTAGDNVPVANETFPVIAFGHGFVMGYNAYENIWTPLVNNGYIVAMVNTETSFTPSHGDFGKDLAFVIDQMLLEGSNAASLFAGAISNSAAVMGHSMGGGSSFLAIENSANIDAMVTFAPAETNPSAIGAASSIAIPSLVLAGSNDCVTPIADHQQPMQDALTSVCKTMLTIEGASHCQFANFNLACNFGELTCGTPATISEAEQHEATMNAVLPWLNFYLKNECGAGNTFQSNISASIYSTQQNCSLLCNHITEKNESIIQVFPIPADRSFTFRAGIYPKKIRVTNSLGQLISELTLTEATQVDCSQWLEGMYWVESVKENGSSDWEKILIQHP